MSSTDPSEDDLLSSRKPSISTQGTEERSWKRGSDDSLENPSKRTISSLDSQELGDGCTLPKKGAPGRLPERLNWNLNFTRRLTTLPDRGNPACKQKPTPVNAAHENPTLADPDEDISRNRWLKDDSQSSPGPCNSQASGSTPGSQEQLLIGFGAGPNEVLKVLEENDGSMPMTEEEKFDSDERASSDGDSSPPEESQTADWVEDDTGDGSVSAASGAEVG